MSCVDQKRLVKSLLSSRLRALITLALVAYATGCQTLREDAECDYSEPAELNSAQDADVRQPISIGCRPADAADERLELVAWETLQPLETPLVPEPEQLPAPEARGERQSDLTIERVEQMALAQSPAIEERAAKEVWRSVKDGSIGIGTLFYLAKQHGWSPNSKPASVDLH